MTTNYENDDGDYVTKWEMEWEVKDYVDRIKELEAEREEIFLKDRGRTNEHNILVKENRELRAENERRSTSWRAKEYRNRREFSMQRDEMKNAAKDFTPQPSPIIELRITFDQSNGSVNVHGPLQNRMLCYGMLGMAREIIQKQSGQQQKPGSILIPQIGVKGI